MPNTQIFCKYGLIGENLDLKKNIIIDIDDLGKISNLSIDHIIKNLDLTNNNQNYLLLPGFINSHIHIGDSFAKELGFNRDLTEVVAPPNGIKHKLLKNTPDKIKIKGIKNSIVEMLSSGTTWFIDFRERGIEGIEILKKAKKESLIGNLILGRFKGVNEIESLFQAGDGIGLVSYKHLSSNIKNKLKLCKRKYNKIIACHCAEKVRNKSVINELLNDNLVDVIVHGTQFQEEDLKKILKKKMALVLCPRSNAYFGVGFPPLTEVFKLKIPISLGTDNVMANNLDLFEELRYLYLISRNLANIKNKENLNAKELLKMVTINAAKNFHIEREIGSISEGKYANFFLINLKDPNFFSNKLDKNNIYPLIVQRTKSENIIKTYIKGELVFERK